MSRSAKWRKILLVLAIIVAIGGIGGAITAVLTYHEATKIDRSNPKVVLDAYLRAALVEKDAVGADLYTCDDASQLDIVRQLREELDRRERDFGVTILVDWGAFQQRSSTEGDVLQTDLVITGTKDGEVTSERVERWDFSVVEDDGWRVCGGSRLSTSAGSPSPTPSVTQAIAR
ncbi:hypothetical protein [Catellatospora sp. NPDC049609]|uniref:hypothetical protein n=1 Tax=Catellatospora sp. NPDC049609 TaxID=3155505 RepID=UPI00342E2130